MPAGIEPRRESPAREDFDLPRDDTSSARGAEYQRARIAQEIGAEVLRGPLHYPSESGGWQLGDLDLSEHPDKCRDRCHTVAH